MGRWACLAVSLIGLIVAPSLQLAPEGLWQLIRKFSGFYNIPLIAIVLAALFLPRATSKTALGVVLFHVPIYTVITFFSPVDLTPWRYRWWVVGFLWLCIIALYVLLSPIGIAA